jgi:hypothetical protein
VRDLAEASTPDVRDLAEATRAQPTFPRRDAARLEI